MFPLIDTETVISVEWSNLRLYSADRIFGVIFRSEISSFIFLHKQSISFVAGCLFDADLRVLLELDN